MLQGIPPFTAALLLTVGILSGMLASEWRSRHHHVKGMVKHHHRQHHHHTDNEQELSHPRRRRHQPHHDHPLLAKKQQKAAAAAAAKQKAKGYYDEDDYLYGSGDDDEVFDNEGLGAFQPEDAGEGDFAELGGLGAVRPPPRLPTDQLNQATQTAWLSIAGIAAGPLPNPPHGGYPNRAARNLNAFLAHNGARNEVAAIDGERAGAHNLFIFKCVDNGVYGTINAWLDRDAISELRRAIADNDNVDTGAHFHAHDNLVIPVTGHLGDADQARSYCEDAHGHPRADHHLLAFRVKKGAERRLFGSNAARQTALNIPKIPAGAAAGGEGYLSGYVGLKSEARGDFSLGVNNQVSQLVFQLHIDRVYEVAAADYAHIV